MSNYENYGYLFLIRKIFVLSSGNAVAVETSLEVVVLEGGVAYYIMRVIKRQVQSTIRSYDDDLQSCVDMRR